MNGKTIGAMIGIVVIVFAIDAVEAQQPTHKPGGYHSPEIHQGGSWSHVFNATGVSHYHCHPHPFMQASVEVKESASTAPVTIEIKGFKFVPEHITVGLDTNVTWTNQDASFHTVDESLMGPNEGTTSGGDSPGIGTLAVLVLAIAALMLSRSRRHD